MKIMYQDQSGQNQFFDLLFNIHNEKPRPHGNWSLGFIPSALC